jgi:hypothetical protein
LAKTAAPPPAVRPLFYCLGATLATPPSDGSSKFTGDWEGCSRGGKHRRDAVPQDLCSPFLPSKALCPSFKVDFVALWGAPQPYCQLIPSCRQTGRGGVTPSEKMLHHQCRVGNPPLRDRRANFTGLTATWSKLSWLPGAIIRWSSNKAIHCPPFAVTTLGPSCPVSYPGSTNPGNNSANGQLAGNILHLPAGSPDSHNSHYSAGGGTTYGNYLVPIPG